MTSSVCVEPITHIFRINDCLSETTLKGFTEDSYLVLKLEMKYHPVGVQRNKLLCFGQTFGPYFFIQGHHLKYVVSVLTLIRGFLGSSPSVISEKKIKNHHW